MRIRLPVARLASVLLFAALCAIAAGWALQLLAPRAPVAPGGAVAQAQAPSDLRLAGQLFGGIPATSSIAAASAPSNIQVTGVVAAGSRGIALLAIDGKPAKAFQVGESVSDGLKLVSVSGDSVELDRSGTALTLPAPPRGSIAVLTAGPQRSAGPGAPPSGPPTGVPVVPAPLGPLPPRPLPPSGSAAIVAPEPPAGQPPGPPPGTLAIMPPGGIVAPGITGAQAPAPPAQ
jgi:general secretion pathway protein C